MQTVNRLDPLRNAVDALRRSGPLALIPTMGSLHDGHLSLVAAAREAVAKLGVPEGGHVAVSIFVNPLQFGANEDLAAYPRDLARDSALLEGAGVDLLWAPTVDVMYPAGFAANISVGGIGEGLCGAARPGHFDGVATVVAKLFQQVRPDIALFGEKDWQQLAVIRRMARDLDFTAPHADAILGVPTMREADGLAMSSRNAYLRVDERARAGALPAAMRACIAAIADGMGAEQACEALAQALLASGFASVDYAELRDADTLGVPGAGPARLLVAARIGRARLIDNMAVPASIK